MSDHGESEAVGNGGTGGDRSSSKRGRGGGERGRRGGRGGVRTPAKGQKVNGTTGNDKHPSCYISDDGTDYRLGDCVYVDSRRPDVPYIICSVVDFSISKRYTVHVKVRWFFRPSEVPESVYEPLTHDRRVEKGPNNVFENTIVKQRELFFSDTIEDYSAKLLRGKCSVKDAKRSIENLEDYIKEEDHFFYFFGYNPETRRLSSTKGEIRIGPSHQTSLPECRSRGDGIQEMDDVEESKDELVWSPSNGMDDKNLVVYLNASRSMVQLSGLCKTEGDLEEACKIASGDRVTQATYDSLHEWDYETGAAFEALLSGPLPAIVKDAAAKWDYTDVKRYLKGLRQYGKNFNRIKREFFPDKETSELVDFYYHWKKTQSALTSRPHRRFRRQPAMHWRRLRRKNVVISEIEFVELSSACESDFDSDESGEKESSLYACRHCYTTASKDWHHAGFDKSILCTDCRLYFKRYGEMIKIESKGSPPPFMIKNSEEGKMRRKKGADNDDEDEDPLGNDRRVTRLQKRRLNGLTGSASKKRPGRPKKKKAKRRKRSNDAPFSGSDDDMANLGDDESDHESLAASSRSGSMVESSTGSGIPNGSIGSRASPRKEPQRTGRGRGGGRRAKTVDRRHEVPVTLKREESQAIRPEPQRPVVPQQEGPPRLENDARSWYHPFWSGLNPIFGVPMGFPFPTHSDVARQLIANGHLSGLPVNSEELLRQHQLEQHHRAVEQEEVLRLAILRQCYPLPHMFPIHPTYTGFPDDLSSLPMQEALLRQQQQQQQSVLANLDPVTFAAIQQQQQQAILAQTLAQGQWSFPSFVQPVMPVTGEQPQPTAGDQLSLPSYLFQQSARDHYEHARRELMMHDNRRHPVGALGRQAESLGRPSTS